MAAPKTELYDGVKADLLSTDGIKKVALWNNHIERENVEQAFLYPAVFIEFLTTDYKTRGGRVAVQEATMRVRLHICFESLKDEDTTILELVELVFCNIQHKQYGTWSKMDRVMEEQNFDHPNVQDFMQDYATLGLDDRANGLPAGTDTIDNLNLDSKVVEIANDLDC